MKTYHSFSSRETKQFAHGLAQRLLRAHAKKHALVIALYGDLGSGKTTFVQGFSRGLGIKKRVVSPTFIIMRRTALRKKRFRSVFHIDAYRIKIAKELSDLGFKKILEDPKNIALVEWAENVKKILPKDAARFRFAHGKKENERTIRFHI